MLARLFLTVSMPHSFAKSANLAEPDEVVVLDEPSSGQEFIFIPAAQTGGLSEDEVDPSQSTDTWDPTIGDANDINESTSIDDAIQETQSAELEATTSTEMLSEETCGNTVRESSWWPE